MDDSAWVVARDQASAVADIAAKLGVAPERISLQQDEDVLDTWFSSQLFPFAVFGWPEATPDLSAFYPGSLLETGHDIIFFWVARMVMIGLELLDQLPFTEVYLHAMVRDAHGRKMSKSLGNVIDPIDVIRGVTLAALQAQLEQGNLDKREVAKAQAGQQRDYPQGIPECGTDALRFALCAYTAQGRDINLDVLRVHGYRRFCNKLWQATRFALQHALGTDYAAPAQVCPTTLRFAPLDRWMLSRCAAAVDTANRGFETYDFPAATTACHNLWLHDLCDVYLEAVKPVVRGTCAEARAAVQATLYAALDVALRLIHPFMPFVSEELFQRLPRRAGAACPPSLCVTPYPTCAEWAAHRDTALEAELVLALGVVHELRSLRAVYQLRPRDRPQVHLVCSDGATTALLRRHAAEVVAPLALSAAVHVLEAGRDAAAPAGCAVLPVTARCTAHLELAGLGLDLVKGLDVLRKRHATLLDARADVAAKIAAPSAAKIPAEERARMQRDADDKEKEAELLCAALNTLQALIAQGTGAAASVPSLVPAPVDKAAAQLFVAPDCHFTARLQVAARYGGVRLTIRPRVEAPAQLEDAMSRLSALALHRGGAACLVWQPSAAAELLGGLRLKSGVCPVERALVTQWVALADERLLPALRTNIKSRGKPIAAFLQLLETHLATRTFLVVERVTLADVAVACNLRPYVSSLAAQRDSSWGARTNVLRWYETVSNQSEFAT